MADLEQSPEVKPLPKFCLTCKWLNYEPEAKLQECRRNAPTRNKECTACCFPPVPFMLWCGQYEPVTLDVMVIRKALIKANKEAKPVA